MNNEIVKQNEDGSFITIEAGKNGLTPEMIRSAIGDIENQMLAVQDENKIALETLHNFLDGVYTRTVFMKAGSLITGKIHKLEHLVIIGKGRASVVSEEFGAKEIKAPMIFKSRPVVKRLLFIHEDMIWTTVHSNPTNTRDLDELEEFLVLKEYDELSQGDKK